MARLLFTLALAAAAAVLALGQTPVPRPGASGEIFSGNVTAVSAEKITVVLKVPARPDESRDFTIGKDTKVEGHLHMNARVSVRFKTDEDGVLHALRIIVRGDTKTGGPGAPRPPVTKK